MVVVVVLFVVVVLVVVVVNGVVVVDLATCGSRCWTSGSSSELVGGKYVTRSMVEGFGGRVGLVGLFDQVSLDPRSLETDGK